ncbi:MAG: ribosomal protein S18-alanine N-acetyltransferase [Acidobacteriota bacterium]
MTIDLRLMGIQDVPEVVAIENNWNFLSKWGERGYTAVLSNPHLYTSLLAQELGPMTRIVGFCVLGRFVDHAELCNIVVLPEYVGKGVGSLLIEQCFAICQQSGISKLSLEVRQSNQRALRFYERHGFSIHSARKNYYRNPPEDAWVMERCLPHPLPSS